MTCVKFTTNLQRMLTNYYRAGTITVFKRQINTFQLPAHFNNRNPRNLERMRIGYKPDGYHMEALGRRFWYSLILNVKPRHITALVKHHADGIILNISTAEWALAKQLYSATDRNAYHNLGRVLAERCLRSGITEMDSHLLVHNGEVDINDNSKMGVFLNALREGGIKLQEATQYKKPNPWDKTRPTKPWTVQL